MSWVFLGPQFVYKLKKPVCYEFLDFSTLEGRRRDCEREVRLNRRLAQNVYLGTVALGVDEHGGLTLGGTEKIVDWLVKMQRLPSDRMLDMAIRNHTVSGEDIARVCGLLTGFYRHIAAPVVLAPKAYRQRFAADISSNFTELGKAEFGLPHTQLEQLAAAQQRFVAQQGEALEQRAGDAHIVEAHGDLRPEHICLLREPVVIDCLEFNRNLRVLDPVDELAYLALECERLDAPEIGDRVLSGHAEVTGDQPAARLVDFYKAFRACLRAKIALWHTDDHDVRDHDQWRARARDYLELAARYLS